MRPVIDQMFEEINQFPKVAFEMEEDSSMAGLVAQGFGIAVMPDIPILKSLNLKTLEISHPVYERSVYLATLKNTIFPLWQSHLSNSSVSRERERERKEKNE